MNMHNRTIAKLLCLTNLIIGLDGFELSEDFDVDGNDVNKAIMLMNSSSLGEGNDYNSELSIAMYLDKVEKITKIKSVSKQLLAYVEFLVLDALAKYTLEQAYQKCNLDESRLFFYKEKLYAVNKYIRETGPIEALEKCMDEYLECCRSILDIVAKETYGCAC